MPALEVVTLALSAGSVLMLAVLVLRRLVLARRARRRRELEAHLKPIALGLLDSGGDAPASLTPIEKEALADVMGRYARAVRGSSHDRIVSFFEREGTVAAELEAMRDGGPAWRRATAAFRLGDIAPQSAVPGLIEALGDPDRGVRIAAVRSLGQLRASEAVEPLLRAAGDHLVPDALVGWALLQIGPPALPTLRTLLEYPEPRGRAAAVQLIGLLGGPGDAAPIQERLRDSSADVREQAAIALGRIGSGRSVPALLDGLSDRIPAVRRAAAVALGQLRDGRSVEALLDHALHDGFDVARAAAGSLAAVAPAVAADAATASASPHLREAVDLANAR